MYAFDRKRIIDVARVKRDLRRDGGNGPEMKEGKLLSDIPIMQSQARSKFLEFNMAMGARRNSNYFAYRWKSRN